MTTTIFTDGSSRGNPGPGGWGSVLIEENGSNKNDFKVLELGGGVKMTTNNKMELKAAIEGLKKASKESEIKIYSDSSYVINGITKWVFGWKRNDWKTKTKDDVLNKDLWLELIEATKDKKVKWQYVGGHVGILGNERCDHIATAFADGMDIKLFNGLLANYDLPNILDISHNESLATSKKSSSSHSKAKAYSYVSSIGGVVEVHHSWAECEKRVKGAKGARYKKALNKGDEERIRSEFV